MWSFNAYMWPLVLALVVQIGALVSGWYGRKRVVGQYYLVFMLACLGWTCGHLFEYGVQQDSWAILAWRLQYLINPFIGPFVFLFTMHVIGLGHRIPRWGTVLLISVSLVIVLVAQTNTYHNLHFQSLRLMHTIPYSVVDWQFGPFAYFELAFGTILPLVGSFFALRFSFQNYAILRRRAIMTGIATLLPYTGFLVYLFELSPLESYNLAPILITFSGIIFARSIRHDKLLDIIPIARHQVVEQMAEGVIIIDANKQIIDCNLAAAAILDVDREALFSRGMAYWQAQDHILNEIIENKDSAPAFTMGDRHYQVSTSTLNKRGQKGTVIIISDITVIKEAEAALLRSNEELERMVAQRTAALTQVNKDLTTEIEERKRAEAIKRKLEEKLQTKQRLEAIGTFTSGIAHDFNNILHAINIYVDILKDTPSESHETEIYDNLGKAAEQGSGLIKQILTFSRGVTPDIKQVNCAEIIEDAANLLRTKINGNHIHLSLHITPCPAIAADPVQIHQIIMNLGTNAIHAVSPEGGEVKIFLRPALDPQPEHAQLNRVEILVEDTGKGIHDVELERIFDPFFSTKTRTGGTGLGLSVVHGIVTAHGGKITVESELGKGTSFKIYLPAITGEIINELDQTNTSKYAAGDGISVLFVDEHEPLRLLASQLLSPKGFMVDTVETAEEALIALERRAYQVMVTDMEMPGMDGVDLISTLHKRGTTIPAIVMSGMELEFERIQELVDYSTIMRIEKPVRFCKLSQCIRDIVSPHFAEMECSRSSPVQYT